MKKRILATTLAALMCLGAASAAQNYKRNIEVEYGIGLLVNGQATTLRDPNGKVVQPFVHAGTTYVPLRSVSELLGAKIGYDSSRNVASVDERKSDADERLEAALYMTQVLDITHMMSKNVYAYRDYLVYPISVSDANGFRQTSNNLISDVYGQLLGDIWHNTYRPQFSPTCDTFLTLTELQNNAYTAIANYEASPTQDKLTIANYAINELESTVNHILNEVRGFLEDVS